MGGARALEWAVGHADRIRSALVLAVGARATADQIGIQSTRSRDQGRSGLAGRRLLRHRPGPTTGMGIARRMAHLSYRAEVELDDRFGNDAQGSENPLADGRYAVESYLEHQSAKLGRRFDPGSYVVIYRFAQHPRRRPGTWRCRGCVARLHGTRGRRRDRPDRLYPLRLQVEIAENLGNAVGGLHVVRSDKGHDGSSPRPTPSGTRCGTRPRSPAQAAGRLPPMTTNQTSATKRARIKGSAVCRMTSWEDLPDGQLAYTTLAPLPPRQRRGVHNDDGVPALGHAVTARQRGPALYALTGDSISPARPMTSTGRRLVEEVIGQGRAIDTDEWCVISMNILGGCQGSTGPSSIAPDGSLGLAVPQDHAARPGPGRGMADGSAGIDKVACDRRIAGRRSLARMGHRVP